MRLTRRFLEIHAEHVDAPGWLGAKVVQVFVGHADQLALLVAVDGKVGGLHIPSSAGLDCDEAENISFLADQVDFASPARRAEISGDDDITESAQVKVGGFFTATAGLLVLWSIFGAAGAGDEPIESLESDFGEAAGHGSVQPRWHAGADLRAWPGALRT